MVEGRRVRALVDSGCSTTVLAVGVVGQCKKNSMSLMAVDGREIKCWGTAEVELTVENVRVRVQALVLEKVIDGIEVVMGMDVISQLGEVTFVKGKVVFGKMAAPMAEREKAQCSMAVESKNRGNETDEAAG